MQKPTQAKGNVERNWQEESGRKWVRMQARTDAQLSPLGLLAMDALSPRSGERVLDVGCGAGQTLVQLAERVAPNGRVIALDISEPLLTRAEALVAEGGHTSVDFVLASAASHRFAEPVDAIYSRFGVMFFEDVNAAFQNLRRALRVGGRLGFVCWQDLELNEWATLPLAAVRSVAPTQPNDDMMAPGKPGPFYFADPEFVKRVLGDAGFRDVVVTPHITQLHFGASRSVEEAVEFAQEIGPSARFIAAADPELLPQFREALKAALSPYVTAGGVLFEARTFVVTANG